MARDKRADPRPAPRLTLITPPIAEAPVYSDKLAAALDAGDVAAVLLRLADGDERALINRVKTLAPVVQDKGAALLLDGHAELVARAGADGAHLTGLAAFSAALDRLKLECIAGVGGLTTRHDTMVAAEAGADYVMFGEPNPAGHRPSFDAILDRVEWWAEVFEIPCVGYAGNIAEIAPLTHAGADFVAVGPFIFADPRGPAPAIHEAMNCLVVAESVA